MLIGSTGPFYHNIYIEAGKTKWSPSQDLGAGEEILTVYKEYNGQEIEVARMEIKLGKSPIDSYDAYNIYIKKAFDNHDDGLALIHIRTASPYFLEDLS